MNDGRLLVLGALGGLLGISAIARSRNGSPGIVRRGQEGVLKGLIVTPDHGEPFEVETLFTNATTFVGDVLPRPVLTQQNHATVRLCYERYPANEFDDLDNPTYGWGLHDARVPWSQFVTLHAKHGIEITLGRYDRRGQWDAYKRIPEKEHQFAAKLPTDHPFPWVKVSPTMIVVPGKNDRVNGHTVLFHRDGPNEGWKWTQNLPGDQTLQNGGNAGDHFKFSPAPASGSKGVVRARGVFASDPVISWEGLEDPNGDLVVHRPNGWTWKVVRNEGMGTWSLVQPRPTTSSEHPDKKVYERSSERWPRERALEHAEKRIRAFEVDPKAWLTRRATWINTGSYGIVRGGSRPEEPTRYLLEVFSDPRDNLKLWQQLDEWLELDNLHRVQNHENATGENNAARFFVWLKPSEKQDFEEDLGSWISSRSNISFKASGWHGPREMFDSQSWTLRPAWDAKPPGSRGIVRGRGGTKKSRALEILRTLNLRITAHATEMWSGETLIAMIDGTDRAKNYFVGNLADAGLGAHRDPVVIQLPGYVDYSNRVPLSKILLGSHLRGAKRRENVENVMVAWENAPELGINDTLLFRGNRPELYKTMKAIGDYLGVPHVWHHDE